MKETERERELWLLASDELLERVEVQLSRWTCEH